VSLDDRTARGGGWSTDDAVELYAAHRLSLVRLAVLLVDDLATAEDVVQQAFAGFLRRSRRSRRLDDPDEVLTYLRTAVVAKARSVTRIRRKASMEAGPQSVEPEGGIDLSLPTEHRDVLEALRLLPPRQREVLVLRLWSELPDAEIADMLRVSRGAVESTTGKALAAVEADLGSRR
jgi:RNA polymerase sigma factor (sigma-70 family)